MLYQRSLDIERRLQNVLRLIRSGGYSTPMIAQELDVSIPTISRDVTALRERGHEIRSERKSEGWRYVLVLESSKVPPSVRGLLAEVRH
jgi:predicted DNA-binding transcriptional regulator YafY